MKSYNKKNKVLDDIFVKYCKEMWSKMQIVEYLINKYGYTPSVAQRYYERLRQLVTEHSPVDYENDLAQTIEYMQQQIQTEENSFTRLQWVKELNKIKGLHINKYQVETTQKNITFIELVNTLPNTDQPLSLTDGEITPIELKQSENKEERQ